MLRRATATDAHIVRELTRAAYAKWVPIIGREPKPMTADYDIAVRDHRIDLLEIDGTLTGLIEMVDGQDHLLIENIAILPAFQSQGLGRQLMAHAETVAVALGHAQTRLYTNKAFADNVRLYLALGYQVTREAPIGDGVVLHMSKVVSA